MMLDTYYYSLAAARLGMMQIVICFFILLTQFLMQVILDSRSYYGVTPFMASLWCILSGIPGIMSARRKSEGSVICTLIFSLLGSLFAVGFILETTLFVIPEVREDTCEESSRPGTCLLTKIESTKIYYLAIQQAILGAVEFIVCIIAAYISYEGCSPRNQFIEM